MSVISALLVPLDGSDIAARGLGCAAWLASRLGAQLHVLYSGEPLPADQALDRLGVPQEHRPSVELHQASGEPTADILAALEQYGIGLIVMTARGRSAAGTTDAPPELLGHVARGVIEQSPIAVLVLPGAYEEVLPWRGALVPVSGELETDQSLTLALQLANALDFDVSIAHVVQDAQAGASRARYMDASHHEWPQLLNEMVARACALSAPAERRRIGSCSLYLGDVARELLGLLGPKHVDAVIVGWHGFFEAGHAQVLKALLRRLHCPVLLVKPRPRAPFRLKVGDALA